MIILHVPWILRLSTEQKIVDSNIGALRYVCIIYTGCFPEKSRRVPLSRSVREKNVKRLDQFSTTGYCAIYFIHVHYYTYVPVIWFAYGVAAPVKL